MVVKDPDYICWNCGRNLDDGDLTSDGECPSCYAIVKEPDDDDDR